MKLNCESDQGSFDDETENLVVLTLFGPGTTSLRWGQVPLRFTARSYEIRSYESNEYEA